MSQNTAYTDLQERYLAAQERHVAALEDLIRSKDAEIARLKSATGPSKGDTEDDVLVKTHTDTNANANTNTNTIVTTHKPAWDESSDPVQSFSVVLRRRYAYFSSLAPPLKPIIQNAIERYLIAKVGRVLFTNKGKLGIPTSLHVDFLEWVQQEIDGGLLDPVPPVSNNVAVPAAGAATADPDIGSSKRKTDQDREKLGDEESETQRPAIKKPKKRRNRTPKLPVIGVKTQPPPAEFEGWVRWTKVVQDRDSSYIPDPRGSAFMRTFCEQHDIPDYRMAGETTKVKTRALPEKYHDKFFTAYRAKDFYSGDMKLGSETRARKVPLPSDLQTISSPDVEANAVISVETACNNAIKHVNVNDHVPGDVPALVNNTQRSITIPVNNVAAMLPAEAVAHGPVKNVAMLSPETAQIGNNTQSHSKIFPVNAVHSYESAPDAQQSDINKANPRPPAQLVEPGSFSAMDVMKWVQEQQSGVKSQTQDFSAWFESVKNRSS